MKIHRLNSQGTIGIVIPKDIAEMLGWKESQDVIVRTTENNYTLELHNKTLQHGEGSNEISYSSK